MLRLKDIYRHFGMRKTHAVLVCISHREELPEDWSPVAADLEYIGLAARTVRGDYVLTEEGMATLLSLNIELGQVHRRRPEMAAA